MKKNRFNFMIFCLTAFIILSLSSCVTKHKYTYSGESDKFIAELEVNETIKNRKTSIGNEIKRVFRVTYKGETSELKNYSYLTISYKSNASGIEETFDLEKQLFSKTFKYQIMCEGGAVENESDTIYAIVKLDEDVIEIPMKIK